MRKAIEFWSSVQIGTFAPSLMLALSERGWSAQQRFGVTETDYRQAKTPFGLARLRWQSYVSYVNALRSRLGTEPAPTAIVVSTNTFYAPAVALRAARAAGIPVIHWVFDLFPDVLVEGGTLRTGGAPQRMLGHLTKWTFHHAAANVFLGQRLLEHAEACYGHIPRSRVIPVGADGDPFQSHTPRLRSPDHKLRVLYSGNLGRMHDTATIVDLLKQGAPVGWTLAFRGHGSGFRSLESMVAGSDLANHLVLAGPLPDLEWTDAMLAADIALVTMSPGAAGLVMPSKTYSAMVSGQAILAISPLKSDLADTVRRHDAGWVVEPGDVAALRAVLTEAAQHPDKVLAKRLHAFRAGHEHYTQRTLATEWIELLEWISRSSPVVVGA